MSSESPLFRLSPIPPDPIFTAALRAKTETQDVINGTIGVILDEEEKLLLWPCIEKALSETDRNEMAYPPLEGFPGYLSAVRELVFGSPDAPAAAVASTGGTGALSILLRLARSSGYQTTLLPVPTWANHRRVLEGAGCTVQEHAYLEGDRSTFQSLLAVVQHTEEPCLLVLQAGCHNPTGLDPAPEEWNRLVETLAGSPHAVLLDCAYQGLGKSTKEDAAPMTLLAAAGVPLLVAWSASKNHCLYGLRTGAALAYAPSTSQQELLQQHLTAASRALVSVAPATGQRVVAHVQEYSRIQWEKELQTLRALLRQKRAVLAEALPASAEHILQTRGLFLQLPLDPSAVEALTGRGVFLTPDGRLTLGSIPLERIPDLGSAIAGVLR